MSHRHQIDRAIRKAAARDRKRAPRMKVTGTAVFALKKLLRQKKR